MLWESPTGLPRLSLLPLLHQEEGHGRWAGRKSSWTAALWRLKKFSHYKKACKHCEQELKGVTAEQWDDLIKRQNNDKGFGGRALSTAYAPSDLQKGDRLEPTSANPDWEMTEKDAASDVPWCRPANESIARHRGIEH